VRFHAARSDANVGVALMGGCAGPEVRCNTEAYWSDAYAGVDAYLQEGESILVVIDGHGLPDYAEGNFWLHLE